MNKIDKFSGNYRFLSNFYPAIIIHHGITYPTSEHLYQAAKTTDFELRKKIAALPTPGNAKRAGRNLKIRANWDDIKVVIMKQIVLMKFKQNPKLISMLTATGNAYLEEGNTWGDKFWGVCGGVGENHLGEILMDVRSYFKGLEY